MYYSRKATRAASFMLFLAAVLCFATIAAVPCRAYDTWTVTTSSDDVNVPGSLRAIIVNSADSGDTISFDIGAVGNLITLSGDQIEISKDLTIRGPGSDDLAIGGGTCRCFYIHECSVDISGLSVVSGDAGSMSNGGGIYCQSADLTLKDCALSGNTAGLYGGGIYNESVSADIANCTFDDNTAVNGGGMFNDSASADITNCTFSGNTTVLHGGGIYNYSVSMDIANCTFSGNITGLYGGGIYNESVSADITDCTCSDNAAVLGGGIYNESGSAGITNCTFSENTAIQGGGMFNDSAFADITNCTFSENIASDGGSGLYNYYDYSDITACSMVNCIFWDKGISEIANAASCDVKPTIGYCVVSGDIDSSDVSGDLSTVISSDPMLGELDYNGGPTRTCALLSGSSAIDAGTADGAPDKDQRGIARPRGNGYDIGAYEAKESTGNSGCSIGYIGPAAMLLFAPLCMLLKKR